MPEKLSESDLCEAFSRWARKRGWIAYAETAGWDLLLVRGDGVQLGIHAKLAFNATLLWQVLPKDSRWHDHSGPDYRGILIPKWSREVREVCEFCGLLYFMPGNGKRHRNDGDGSFDAEFIPELNPANWDVWPTDARVALPSYIPDVKGGASAPVQLTEWKIAALKICARLAIRGYVMRQDFRDVGIDYRRWVPMKWLEIEDGKYIRGPKLQFDQQHPQVYATILNEQREFLTDKQSTMDNR